MAKLTVKYVTTLKSLLLAQDTTTWDIGDYLAQNPLSPEDLEKVAEQVDRTVASLRGYQTVSAAFPALKWDRNRASLGVFKQLARIEDEATRRALLDSKPRRTWKVLDMQDEVEATLGTPVRRFPSGPVAKLVTFGKNSPVLDCSYNDGVLVVRTQSNLAAGRNISRRVDEKGNTFITITFDQPSALRVAS